MYVIHGNYGDPTMAVIAWAKQKGLQNVTVVSVDTGWAAPQWEGRINLGQAYAKQCGFGVVRLKAEATFEELVKARKSFPSQKFQWCPALLKGMPLLDWLDEVDPTCQATIIYGKRRGHSRLQKNLTEFIESSEHHEERKVWYPLYSLNDIEYNALIDATGLDHLNHRSLECDPCIHNHQKDFLRMESQVIDKTETLEKAIGKPMFSPLSYDGASGIRDVINRVRVNQDVRISDSEQFDMGCGSPFGCGE